jgi:hypothetical protein
MTYKVSSGGRRLPCRPRALPLIGLLLVHTACYSYKPVNTSPAVSGSSSGTAAAVEPTEENPELKQGDRIRVHLSEPGDYELMDVVPRNVTLIDGELIRWTEDELLLSAWWMKAGSGLEFAGQGETVAVPGTAIGRVERRVVSVGKTAGIAVLIAGAVAALGVVFGTSGGESGGTQPPVQPQ